MLMSRRRRTERKGIEIYINNKTLKQVKSTKYLGIICGNKITLRGHIKYIEEKCIKLIFSLSKSAKIIRGLKREELKNIYTEGILPLLLYVGPEWKSVLNNHFYKAKLIRI